MIRHQNVVCFAGEDWWYHNPHSNLHLMKAMAQNGNRVLFVNSIGIRMPDLKRGKSALRKIANKARSMLRYLVHAEPNIHVLTPFALPYVKSWEKLIHPANTWLVTLQLRLVLSLLGFKQPIFWVCIPTVKDIVFRLMRTADAQCLVYYCVDNITYHAGERDLNVLRLETELHARANVALFVNRQLINERAGINPDTYYLEHGVDYEHFARAQSGSLPVPADIAAIRKPIVGYIGVLRGLDYDLIRYLAERNMELSFVFIGEVDENVPLRDLTNVHFLGKKRYEDLPDYMQAMDCLTIFYQRQDVFNNYRNPKKLLEYFASGKPVVAVRNLELGHFEGMIALAEDFDDFNSKLRHAISHDPLELRRQRIAYAEAHTWDHVAAKASSFIESCLNGGADFDRSRLRASGPVGS